MGSKRWTDQEEQEMLELIEIIREEQPGITWEDTFKLVADTMDKRTKNAIRDRYYAIARDEEDNDESVDMTIEETFAEIYRDLNSALQKIGEVEDEVTTLLGWVEDILFMRKQMEIRTDKDYTVTSIKKGKGDN